MLKIFTGIAIVLFATIPEDTVIGTPEAMAQADEWIEAEITSVTADEAVVVDVDGWTFTIAADGWAEGQHVLIVEDDGEIENIKEY